MGRPTNHRSNIPLNSPNLITQNGLHNPDVSFHSSQDRPPRCSSNSSLTSAAGMQNHIASDQNHAELSIPNPQSLPMNSLHIHHPPVLNPNLPPQSSPHIWHPWPS